MGVEFESGVAASAVSVDGVVGVTVDADWLAVAQGVHEGAGSAGGADAFQPRGAVGVQAASL